MTTRAKFEALAALHGISVEYHPGGIIKKGPQTGERYAAEIMLDAPEGKIFGSSDCHTDGSLNHNVEVDGTKTDWKGAYKALQAIISYGLHDCPDRPNCDMCDPIEEE